MNLDTASVIRTVAAMADVWNKYTEDHQPWSVIKTDPERPVNSDGDIESARF
jgi:methionyl-tRNA synthetase